MNMKRNTLSLAALLAPELVLSTLDNRVSDLAKLGLSVEDISFII